MFRAKQNLIKENGDLIKVGTENLKPSDIGSKETIQRFLDLDAIEEQPKAKESNESKAEDKKPADDKSKAEDKK